MLPDVSQTDRRALEQRLRVALCVATQLFGEVSLAMNRGDDDHRHWQRIMLGHDFSACSARGDWPGGNIAGSVGTWLHAHEDAQVMLASMLVVFSIWWVVRTVLALLINLVCPLLVVLLAVVCVPQLRAPLLGQNYPVVVDMIRNILLKMAENMRT